MTLRQALLLMVLWFVVVFLAALLYISFRQPPSLAVEEVALAPACGPKPNPCLKIDCNKPAKGYIA